MRTLGVTFLWQAAFLSVRLSYKISVLTNGAALVIERGVESQSTYTQNLMYSAYT